MSTRGHHGLLLNAGGGGGGGDPDYASVVSLQNWGGADGSTTFTDAKGKTWTGFGNAQIDTDFGQSLLLDGSGDYITTPDSADFNFGSGDFTEEGFFRESVSGAIRQIIGQHTAVPGGESNSSFLILSDNAKLTFQVFIGGSFFTAANPSTHSMDTIYHYAAVRDGGNIRLYLDGVQVAATSITGSLNDSSREVTIGTVMNDSTPNPGNYFFNGRIFSRRTTKGVCRYPGGTTFTPPAYPFPTS